LKEESNFLWPLIGSYNIHLVSSLIITFLLLRNYTAQPNHTFVNPHSIFMAQIKPAEGTGISSKKERINQLVLIEKIEKSKKRAKALRKRLKTS
jgi:hypothetical protein